MSLGSPVGWQILYRYTTWEAQVYLKVNRCLNKDRLLLLCSEQKNVVTNRVWRYMLLQLIWVGPYSYICLCCPYTERNSSQTQENTDLSLKHIALLSNQTVRMNIEVKLFFTYFYVLDQGSASFSCERLGNKQLGFACRLVSVSSSVQSL